ncbi:MAG: hypothetical protein L3J83_00925 [Proteobacteria bacterium]|nr:hypothetical protein [Pseudomonadota bacterium]
MKNKIIGLLIVLIVLSIYPTWRYFSNANILASAIFEHASGLGKWSHGSVNTNLDGKITIRNISFSPKNHTQGFEIESISMSVEPMFLLKTSAQKLEYLLPEAMSISINGAVLNSKSGDINALLRNDSMWMLLAGYAGSFGCARESYTSFDKDTWNDILSNDQIYNVDLFYSRQQNGSIDVDLVLDAENLFSSTWSSNLKSSYNDKKITASELIVDKLFYNYLDNGFNQARNDACKENYNASFSTYRLSSAEHVQKYLRTYFSKELPEVLINWYQRMLVPDVEYNAIITLDERKFLSEVFRTEQRILFENSLVEIATTEDEYLPIVLEDIDYTNIDPELLRKENIKREQDAKKAEAEKVIQKTNKRKPKIFKTGRAKTTKIIAVSQLSTVINKKIRIKTKKGRPITGYLRSVDSGKISIESRYKTGTAKLNILIKKIATAEVVR